MTLIISLHLGGGGVTFSLFCSPHIMWNSPTVSPISWLGFNFICKYQFSSQTPARKTVPRYPAAIHPPHSVTLAGSRVGSQTDDNALGVL